MVTQPTDMAGTVYNPSAEVYERELVPAIFRSWGTRLLDVAAPRTGERVLDVACGTGIVARLAAARVGPGGTVAGVDINPAMLEVARRGSADVRPEISWHPADAAVELPFAEASFDVVTCQQGLQFFGDRTAGLREIRRVTAPRGRVAVSVWRGLDQHPAYTRQDETLKRYLDHESLAGSDAPFSLTDPDELRDLFRSAGFTDLRLHGVSGDVRFASARHMLEAVTGAHAPLAGAVASLDPAKREELVTDLTTALEPYSDDDGVVFPMVASVILARP